MSIYAVLTPAAACRALREAGFSHPAEALHIDAREERWAVSLPDDHIAWFPASEAGATRLAVERRVLGLLAKRCSFRVPEMLFISNSGFDHCEPDLLAQLDEPFTQEREDGLHRINHQMIVEQRETGKSCQFSGNCELSRSSRPIEEKEFHPQTRHQGLKTTAGPNGCRERQVW